MRMYSVLLDTVRLSEEYTELRITKEYATTEVHFLRVPSELRQMFSSNDFSFNIFSK